MGFGSLPTTIIFACVIALSVSIITSLIFVSVKYSARTSYGIFDAISKSSSRFTGLMDSQTPRFLIQPYVVYKNCCYFMFGTPRDNVRFKKLEVLTLDQLNQIFPLQKYNEWLEGDKTVDISKVEYLENIDEKLVEHSTEPTHSETQADEIPNQKEQDITEMDIKNASMPRTDYKNEKHFTSGICAICIETLEEEDCVRGLICGHVFHDNCIDPWLTERRGCCPTCKKDLYMEINSNQIESPVSEETSGNEDEVNQTPVNITYKISDYIKLPRRGDPGDMELDDLFNIDYSNPFTFFLVLKIFELQSKTLLLALQYIRNGTYYDHSSYSITESDDLIEFHVNENQISADKNQYITMFNSKFIQTIVSSDFFAPPLPSLQNINPQLRRIVESSPKPFNANDLIDLDIAAFEKTNKMTNGFNKVKFKILGIKKMQLYYYNVVSIYNERRHNRIQNHVVNNDTV